MREFLQDLYPEIKSISVIGNYLPRKCGIASFTTDLVESLTNEATESDCWATVINDKRDSYSYPDKVRFEINQNYLADYRKAAEYINIKQADVVCLQHEYGIFGGPAGSYILDLLRKLKTPIVTTLHTILVKPEKEYYRVMIQLSEISDKLVVMSKRAVDILNSVYGIAREKIVYIPHGIPDMPFIDPNYHKEQFGLLGKNVLMTFGLLSQNKGIEYAIRALPDVIRQYPDLKYMILGVTHPHVLKTEGEKYRSYLQDLVQNLKLDDHVEFQNRFVSLDELCDYLAAADLYITPYIDEAQITSGTLAYAMGTGKAVISTPYWYAEEMLSDGRGSLVPFKNSPAISESILHLLEKNAERQQVRIRAYDYSRSAVWHEVARQYLKVFQQVKKVRDRLPSPNISSNGTYKKPAHTDKLPEINLDHLCRMTDDTGIIQHAKFTIPDRNFGYCTDDNARALIAVAMARRLTRGKTDRLDLLCSRYLSFILHAFDTEKNRFRNFMGYDRQWLEEVGSEDSHGRSVWALGLAISLLEEKSHNHLASMYFTQSLKAAETFQAPRSIAFTLIGTDAYLGVFSGDSNAWRSLKILGERLFSFFRNNSTENWPWPEEKLTYANGKLPHALLLSGQWLQNDDMIQTGLSSLKWLLKIQTANGHLVPVGNQGWFFRGGEKPRFDQQPIEANGLIEACIAAFQVSQNKFWLDQAMMCFNWFLGQNDLKTPLYDERSGGCFDGLQSNGANQNQGAESTLAWLLSLTAIRHISPERVMEEIDNSTKVIS